MIKIQAPALTPETTTFLPNPQSTDVNALQVELEIRRSMNNTVRTFIKSSDRESLSFTFRLYRAKALELRAFILKYYDSKIKLTDHLNQVWLVNFTSNPFEFNAIGRGEFQTITLLFEGTLNA